MNPWLDSALCQNYYINYERRLPSLLAFQSIFLETIALNEDTVVLDAGCGPGKFANYVGNRFGCRMVLVDFSLSMIDLARQVTRTLEDRIQLYHCSIATLPFEDETFSYTFCLNVLHHLTADLQMRARHELVRTLRRGGRLLVNENFAFVPSTPFQSELCRLRQTSGIPVGNDLTKATLVTWFENAGLALRREHVCHVPAEEYLEPYLFSQESAPLFELAETDTEGVPSWFLEFERR